MAKTKKSDVPSDVTTAPAKPRAVAPRKQTARKSNGAAEAAPIDLASVSATHQLAMASDRSAPGTPEGLVDAPSVAPSHDEIAEAAYQRFLQRGGGHGQDFEDWLAAERALRGRR